MKKLLMTVALGVALTFAASAENAFSNLFGTVRMEAGLKGIATTGAGSAWSDDFDFPTNRDNVNFGGGFGLFGHAAFGSGSVRYMNQLEVNLLFNDGIGNSITNFFDGDDEKGYLSVLTLDIPLLFGVDIDVGKIVLSPFIGPVLSVPLTGTATFAGKDYDLSCKGVNFGGTVGLGVGIPVGPGQIAIDARYAYDFTETKMKVEDLDGTQTLYRRGGIQVSLGYKTQLK